MRLGPFWVITMTLLVCSGAARAAEPVSGLPEAVGTALKRAKIPSAGFSAYVQEFGSGRPLLSFNADTPRNPASVIKLVTTYLALESLGPAYVWQTKALVTAPPQGGVLEGDLYLKGGGDPYLVLERFWLLVREIRQRGVREIRGDLVIDNTFFDLGNIRPGDFDGRPFNPYNLVPDALLVNFQTVNFSFRPDAGAGRVEILADPLPANLRISNQVQLVDGRCTAERSRVNFAIAEAGAYDQATFTGRLSRQCGEYQVARSLTQGPAYTYGLFRALWEESGGTLRGTYRVGAAPAGLRTLVTHDSVPLREVVSAINKFSNNVMARHLLLTLGAERFGAPATVDKGRNAAIELLSRQGLDMPELEIGNGSGLARDTRISAHSLSRLLIAAQASPVAAEFQSSLALAGVDGTARRRFRDKEFAGRMHLKTGTLNGVQAIAGYVHARSGRQFAVVILQNHHGWGYEAQIALLRWIYRQ